MYHIKMVINVACETFYCDNIRDTNSLALTAIELFLAALLFTPDGTWPLSYFTDSGPNSYPAR